MRKTATSVLVACLLTACGANADDTATTLSLPPTTTDTTAPTTPTGQTRNERNNIVKHFGELATTLDASGDATASFTIDSIEVDPPCTGDFSAPAENGHLLILNMRVTTGPDLSDFGGNFLINPYDWQVIGADGTTETNLGTTAAFSCVGGSEKLPSTMGPGQQFVGKLALDSRSASGSAIFAPAFVDGGWEWLF